MTLRSVIVVLTLSFLSLPAVAGCSRMHPCLTIMADPSAPVIPDDTPVGSVVTTLTVTVIPKGSFSGTLTFGSPYGDDAGLFALSGSDVVLINSLPPGSSLQHVTVVATQ